MSGKGIGKGAETDQVFPDPPVGKRVLPHREFLTLTPDLINDGTADNLDDISPAAKERLGNYLSDLTKDPGYGNTFTIKPGSTNDSPAVSKTGKPVALNHSGHGAEEVFAPHNDDYHLNSYSDSGAGGGVAGVVTKGKTDTPVAGAKDGHTLLPEISNDITGRRTYGEYSPTALPPTSPALKRTSAILAQNRFTADAAYASIAETVTAPDLGKVAPGRVISSIQSQMGVYNPKARAVTTQELSKVGKSISLRSSGEFFPRQNGADPEDTLIQISTLLPGEAQLALTKPTTREMEAREVFEELFGESFGARLEGDFAPPRDTYGNLNNAIEHFDAMLPSGMIALGIALVIAMQIATAALVATITMLTAGKSGKIDRLATDAIGRFFPGDNRVTNPDEGVIPGVPFPLAPSALGLQEVNFGYSQAVSAGVSVFFTGKLQDLAGQFIDTINPFGDAFKRVLEAPGYNVIFVRNVTRSLNTIATTVANAFSSDNIIQAVQGVGSVFDIIRRSKVIAALNMFAILGDRVLTLKQLGFNVENFGAKGHRFSRTDALPDNNPASHVMKSRRRDSLKLSWRNSSTKSRLLLPEAILIGAITMGSMDKSSTSPWKYAAMTMNEDGSPKCQLGSISAPKKLLDGTSRLSQEQVTEIEATLDAEYVPFYFHDTRTNEIISFHAFLEALGDDYTVNYEPTSAYGRVDDIQQYRNTIRTISVDFFCAATSHADFDELYAKVNKLTTMVYPQYTAGNLVRTLDGNTQFYQPFSQIISATPITRMRVGDVIRSNYSRFNLARVFGLGEFNFKVDGSKTKGFDKADADIKKLTDIVSRMNNGEYKKGDIIKLRPNGGPSAIEGAGYQPAPEKDGLLGAFAGGMASSLGLSPADPIPPLTVTFPLKARIEGTRPIKIETDGQKSEIPGKYLVALMDEDETIAAGASANGAFYVVNFTDIIVDNESLMSTAKMSVSDQDIEKNANFFKPENNVVVRSFEKTMSKGLAGVITSLAFDWNLGTWETERHGSRAPQIFKVTLSYTAIHDIPPGIDDNGFNRAPLYNVGGIMNPIAGDAQDIDGKGRESFRNSRREIDKNVNKRGANS